MTTYIRSASTLAIVLVSAAFLSLSPALAAGEHEDDHSQTSSTDDHRSGGHGHGGLAGKPGVAGDVTRTVTITMGDNFFEPESVKFSPGETIRFVVTNAGELVHEFNVGTPHMHIGHQKEMMMMMENDVLLPDRIDMEAAAKMQETMGHGMHNDPNSVLLEPGKTGEVIWTFPKETETTIEFGCNVPGHYEAGMVGKFQLSDASS